MAKIQLSKTKKIIIIVVAVIAALLIAGGAYCVGTDQNPAEALHSVFSSDDEKLIGKWQSQATPGLSAYVFYEDGTYDNYISNVNFQGNYEVDGSKLILKNPETSKEVVYKFKISGKVLTLSLLEQDSKNTDEKEEIKYDLVDELNQKTLADLIGDLAEDKESTSENE